MEKAMKLAVVGIDTAVGEAIIKLLENGDYHIENLLPLVISLDNNEDDFEDEDFDEDNADDDSSNKTRSNIRIKGHNFKVESLDDCRWNDVDTAIFCLDAKDVGDWAHAASDAGVTVIDASSALIHNSDVKLMQANINVEGYIEEGSMIRTADPISVMLAQVLAPIQNELGIVQVNTTAMLSASHIGKAGVSELAGETARLLNALPAEPKLFPVQTAFNVIPQVGECNPDGYSKLEDRISNELALLLGQDLLSNVTAVQVPLFYGYGLVVDLHTRIPVEVEEVEALFEATPGIKLFKDSYPTAIGEMLSSDDIMVARLRQSNNNGSHLAMWILADNIKVASALNALKLAQSL